MADSPHTHPFLLDGLGDPHLAGPLTRALLDDLRLPARCDPASMTLEVQAQPPLDEPRAEQVAALCRRFALEPKDRLGTTFLPEVSADALQDKMRHEWASRFATALVFLAPALLLHFLMPYLATGDLLVPRLLEAGLVGWAALAAGWPILYQGALAVTARRSTPDLYAAAVIVIAFVGGVAQTALRASETWFHIASWMILLTALQRYLLWRSAQARSGAAHSMLPTGPILLLWAGLAVLVGIFSRDAMLAAALLLLMPANLAGLSINRLSPGLIALPPVVAMGLALLLVPRFAPDLDLASVRIEAAAGLCAVLTLLYGLNPITLKTTQDTEPAQ